MVDSVVVEQGMKLIFWRERPNQDSAQVDDYRSRTRGSIPRFPRRALRRCPGGCGSTWLAKVPFALVVQFVHLLRRGQRQPYTRSRPAAFLPSDVLALDSAAGWLVGRLVQSPSAQIRRGARQGLLKGAQRPGNPRCALTPAADSRCPGKELALVPVGDRRRAARWLYRAMRLAHSS